MKPFGYEPPSDKGGFLVFPWCQIICFLIMATLVPLAFEAHAFAEWHDLKNVIDGTVKGSVFEKQEGMVMLGNLGDVVFNGLFDQGTLPVIFSALGEQKPPPEGEGAPHNCKYKEMVEIQWALLSILIGCIIGNYFGSLYGLRYRSNRY